MVNKLIIATAIAVVAVAVIAAVVLTNGGNDNPEGEYSMADYQMLSCQDDLDNWSGKPVVSPFIINSYKDNIVSGIFGNREFSGVYDNNIFFFMMNYIDNGLNKTEAAVGKIAKNGIIITGVSYINENAYKGAFQFLFTKDGSGALPMFENPFRADDTFLSWHSRVHTMDKILPAEEESLSIIRTEGNFAYIKVLEGQLPYMGCLGLIEDNVAIGIHVSKGTPYMDYMTLINGCIIANSWKLIGDEPDIKVVCYSKDGKEVSLPEVPDMLGKTFADEKYYATVLSQNGNVMRIIDSNGNLFMFMMVGAGDHFISISLGVTGPDRDQIIRGTAGFFSPDMSRFMLLPLDQKDDLPRDMIIV